MKNIKKYRIEFVIGLILVLFGTACNKILDKENLTAVNPSQILGSANILKAQLNGIYADNMPGMPQGTGNGTDEAAPTGFNASAWFRGSATVDSYDIYASAYTRLRGINIFLDNVDKASFDQADKNILKGQGLFWRAWNYFQLVKSYGGVPLIITADEVPDDFTQLLVPRSKTSECIAQMVADLDVAVDALPDVWTGEDVGRIDKIAALAFKGRVLLFFASPLFNPSNDQAKWQAAYDACLAAKQKADENGKGLFAPFNKIWDTELNKEVIMVRRYNFPQAAYFQGGMLPLTYSQDLQGQDKPSLGLVNAFPMKDGSKWGDKARLYDTLFRSRDERFYETVLYNGAPYQYLAKMRDQNVYHWTFYSKITGFNNNTGVIGELNLLSPNGGSPTSFHRIKGSDKSANLATSVYNAAVDWPEIRYAEVLLNFGEAANELGKSSEALIALYEVRKRAGILSGDNNKYGITANSKAAIREEYKNERFVEFAFENKRWDDLRRWRMFGYLRDLVRRKGLAIALKSGETAPQILADIDAQAIWSKFTYEEIVTESSDNVIKDSYYFYPIPLAYINRNPQLIQNNNWGGGFDPLQ
ncbi:MULTISPECIES: RagB/SusD family nutrient uptake outer membrane protein [unclassified Sphingobacterium]|uniref:RagB/SusD family nutrient uptake outer membrane protein n=1 Tax=unclassified Sphingobacterium TaxID=2609468 RepID=UPI001043E775|nr:MULTISPECIES: RagB/SusD family nutrient uptake outer membrane protein [unclassified Sphingobacterium]MCS3554217.1 hypothetical protein [Sphingobacterium sp. JUb21]TCR08050.1 putative outer membrane starch-binding protein [Sphingobacterium sp. JUb20]